MHVETHPLLGEKKYRQKPSPRHIKILEMFVNTYIYALTETKRKPYDFFSCLISCFTFSIPLRGGYMKKKKYCIHRRTLHECTYFDVGTFYFFLQTFTFVICALHDANKLVVWLTRMIMWLPLCLHPCKTFFLPLHFLPYAVAIAFRRITTASGIKRLFFLRFFCS